MFHALRVGARAVSNYYEAGRVISGVDRQFGIFPLSGDGPTWQGAALEVDADTADKWVAAGEAALNNGKYTPQLAKLVQRTLSAVQHPIRMLGSSIWRW